MSNSTAILEAKRIHKRRQSASLLASAVTLVFETRTIPSKVYFGFKVFKVKDYIAHQLGASNV